LGGICLEFLSAEGEEQSIGGLTQGHIVLSGPDSKCSSLDRGNTVMLVLSIIDLVGGLLPFLTTRLGGRQYAFRGIDASYSLKFVRKKSVIVIYCGARALEDNRIGVTTETDLVAAVSSALDQFDKKCRKPNHTSLLAGEITDQWEYDILTTYQSMTARWREVFGSTFPQ